MTDIALFKLLCWYKNKTKPNYPVDWDRPALNISLKTFFYVLLLEHGVITVHPQMGVGGNSKNPLYSLRFLIRCLLHASKLWMGALWDFSYRPESKERLLNFGFGFDSFVFRAGLETWDMTNDRPMYLGLDTPWSSPCIFVGIIEFASLSIFAAQGCKTDINFLNQNNFIITTKANEFAFLNKILYYYVMQIRH